MNKKTINILSIIMALLSIAAIVGILLDYCNNIQSKEYYAVDSLSAGCLEMTLLFGVYYILAGCKKEIGGVLFSWFMGAMALCDLVAIYNVANFPGISTVLMALGIACTTVICFAKDLGRKKSYSFAIIGTIAKIAVVVLFTMYKGFSFRIYTSLLLSLQALFMISAKYYDKAQRGRKVN